MVPYALFRLDQTDAPPQTVHDEILSFDDPHSLLRPHATLKPVPAPSPAVNVAFNDVVLLVTTRAHRAHTNTDHPPQSSSWGISAAPSGVNGFDENC